MSIDALASGNRSDMITPWGQACASLSCPFQDYTHTRQSLNGAHMQTSTVATDPRLSAAEKKLARMRIAETWLQAEFPAAFSQPVPLKIGIHREIIARTQPGLRGAVRRVLRAWTSHGEYIEARIPGATRYGLDGEPCGTVGEVAIK